MKNICQKIACMMALLLPLTLCSPLSFADVQPVSLSVEALNELTGAIPSTTETFTYFLFEQDEATPSTLSAQNLTSGKEVDEVSITGSGTATFDAMTYDAPGRYTYAIQQQVGQNPLCEYDDSIYYLEVYVTRTTTNTLDLQVSAYADGNYKVAQIAFTNHYATPTPSPTLAPVATPVITTSATPTPAPTATPTMPLTIPMTRDTLTLYGWIALAVVSGGCALFFFTKKRNQQANKRDE